MEPKKRYSLNTHREYKIKKEAEATSFNRILAFIFDLFIVALAAMAINTLIFQPIFGFTDKVNEISEIDKNIKNSLVATKLYSYNNENQTFVIDDDYFNEFIKEEEKAAFGEKTQNALYYYYVNYCKMSIENINKEIFKINTDTLKNDLFVTTNISMEVNVSEDVLLSSSNVVNGYYSQSDKNNYDALKKFYMDTISDARVNYTSNESFTYATYLKQYEKASYEKAKISAKGALFSFGIGVLFGYIVVPCIFKKKTFGQLMFKLKIVYIDNEPIRCFDLLTRTIMMLPLFVMVIPFASFPSFEFECLSLPFIVTNSGSVISSFVPFIISIIINVIELFIITLSSKKQPYYDRAYGYTLVSYNEKQINNKKHID